MRRRFSLGSVPREGLRGWFKAAALLATSLLATSLIESSLLVCPARAQIPAVTTRAFDNDRSGANTHETILTRDAVATKGVVRQTVIPVMGDARGMEAQPLILPGVRLKDGSTQDVMILPSMANVVRGVNAETGAGLWQVALCMPINGGPAIDAHQINDKWGVLSTGVLDPATGRAYLVAWCSDDGSGRPQTAKHHVFVLNLADGSQVASVPVEGASGTQRYGSAMRKQRSSLVMTDVRGTKTVFWASGTVLETGNGADGWVFAFDVATNRITAALAMSQGLGAGIWMGGQGLAADAQGLLYAITGNGSFNGVNDFGEAFVKLQYQPPIASAAAWLKVVSWWAPYSDAGRIGENPQLSAPGSKLENKMSGVSAPSEEAAMPVGAGMDITRSKTRTVMSPNGTPLHYPTTPTDPAWTDEDLGSAGGTLIEKYNVYVGGGKDGILYPVKSGDMGRTAPGDFSNAAANCAKLAGPPVWAAFSPGPVPTCPQDETVLDFMPWGKTRHLHATPVQHWSADGSLALFVWGENSNLHKWKMSPGGVLTYAAQGNEYASATVTDSPGGMPGGFCSESSHNGAGAVLWCSIPYGDGNATVTNGRLLAYDPATLELLWDSERWGVAYLFSKFMPPIVWNGRVYLPDYNGGVQVFGLAQ